MGIGAKITDDNIWLYDKGNSEYKMLDSLLYAVHAPMRRNEPSIIIMHPDDHRQMVDEMRKLMGWFASNNETMAYEGIPIVRSEDIKQGTFKVY